jgi:hypothetical protein
MFPKEMDAVQADYDRAPYPLWRLIEGVLNYWRRVRPTLVNNSGWNDYEPWRNVFQRKIDSTREGPASPINPLPNLIFIFKSYLHFSLSLACSHWKKFARPSNASVQWPTSTVVIDAAVAFTTWRLQERERSGVPCGPRLPVPLTDC